MNLTQVQNIPFDIFILLLRLALVFGLYFFLFQVVRVLGRDLRGAQPAPVPSSPYGQLILVAAGTAVDPPGTAYNLEPITTIGRKLTNTIVLDDRYMSGEHARLFLRDGAWWVEDWHSTNGTQVNGAALSRPTPIRPGDVIGVGGAQLRLQQQQ